MGSAVECLRDELYEVRASLEAKGGKLRRAAEERDARRTTAEQKAKEVEQLGASLQSKEGELQQGRTALSEAQSQLALKDAAFIEEQARTERERMSLEDVQARLAQAERKAPEAEGPATTLKEKGDALTVVEG
jgi:chromosome segregation ATPase